MDVVPLETWEDCLYKAEVAYAQGMIEENKVMDYARHLAEKHDIIPDES